MLRSDQDAVGVSADFDDVPDVEKTACGQKLAMLQQLPALVVLEQVPIPVVAVADDTTVLFANTAFVETLGCSQDAVTAMGYEDIISVLPRGEALLAVARLHPDPVEELPHVITVTIYAKVHLAVKVHDAYSQVLATFRELADRVWPDAALGLSTGNAFS